MLHMVIVTHGPDTCPLAVSENRQKATTLGTRLNEVMTAHGITLQGAWTNVPGHASYSVLDAPNAHVINQALIELEVVTWNTCQVNPVVLIQEAMALVQ